MVYLNLYFLLYILQSHMLIPIKDKQEREILLQKKVCHIAYKYNQGCAVSKDMYLIRESLKGILQNLDHGLWTGPWTGLWTDVLTTLTRFGWDSVLVFILRQ